MTTPRSLRALPVLLTLLVACGLLAATVPAHGATASTSTRAVAARKAPGKDYPKMPRHCATPKEEIPAKAVVCRLNEFNAKHPTILLWGDSHAWMMIPALKTAVKGKGVNLVATVMGSCPPMDPELAEGQAAVQCDQNNDMAIKYAEDLAGGSTKYAVVLGASWQRYYHALKTHDRSDYAGQQAVKLKQQTPRLFKKLAKEKIPVLVDGQVPTVPEKKKDCPGGDLPYYCDLPRHSSLPDYQGTQKWLLSLMKPLAGNPKPLDVTGDLCDTKVCHGKIDGVHTWFDDLHLSATRSRRLSHYFDFVVTDVTKKDAVPTEPTDPGTGGTGGGCGIPLLC